MSGERLKAFAKLVRSGAWATPDRLRAYGWILIGAYACACIVLVATGKGLVDFSGRPIGADFGMMWTAGRTALDGQPDDVFSLARQAASQSRLLGEAAGFTPWHYPPVFLLVAAPLAALPYLGALALWLGCTLSIYLAGLRLLVGTSAIKNSSLWLAALAVPAAFVNLAHGQNGFLTAGLLAAALGLLPARPAIAGVLFALLAYKPQFGLLVPVVLLTMGSWNALAAGAATLAILIGATTLIFGAEVWTAFIRSMPDTSRLTLELGATGWEKIQSVFAAVRLVGGSFEIALALQVAVALVTLAATAQVWRSPADSRLKHAVFFAGVLLTTPYGLDYDMVVLGPGLIALALFGCERGFAPYEISFLALVFVTPILSRGIAGAIGLPLGAIILVSFFAWTVARAFADARAAATRISRAPRRSSERTAPSP